MNKAICIVGPTASGKSDLADRVGLRLEVPVISVDAMQVYRGMDIGTAKVPVDERKVELCMVDVADVDENYSVQLFQNDARQIIDNLFAQNRPAVLCGGTGLYLNAVIDQMDFVAGNQMSPYRCELEDYLEDRGKDELYKLLARRDPASAELIHPNNTRRVIRALEMLHEGKSYADQHKGLYKRKPYYDAVIFGLNRSRENLYKRIDMRVDAMFDAGLVDEVQGLKDLGLLESLTSKQAIGYKEVLEALDGKISMDEARERIKINTRHYAKRQMTWFKKDERIHWINLDEVADDEAEQIVFDTLENS